MKPVHVNGIPQLVEGRAYDGAPEPTKQVVVKTDGEVDVSDYHTGNGWYEVPGHENKVRKDEAIALLTSD